MLGLILFAGCGSTKNGTPAQPEPQPAPASTETSNPATSATPDAQTMLLNQIIQLANQGKVLNCEFPVDTTVIETVKAKWGEPDQQTYIAAAKGTYATYLKHNAAFGFNKGSQIFDVRTYDNSIKDLTQAEIEAVLGTPENIHNYATQDMLVYQVGEKYQLLFIFPKATQQNPVARLDHYNLFYPAATVNSMADDPGIKY
jgi:hypothetical protein